MKYFFTTFWVVLLFNMASFVVNSINGTTYDFKMTTIFSLFMAVLIIFISKALRNKPPVTK